MRKGYEYPKVLYRAVSEFRPTGMFGGDDIHIWYLEYKVVKHTDCGVWVTSSALKQHQLRDPKNTPKSVGCKWVCLTGRKRFAYPTKEEALESLRIRKVWQARYAKNALALAQETQKKIALMRKEEADEVHNDQVVEEEDRTSQSICD